MKPRHCSSVMRAIIITSCWSPTRLRLISFGRSNTTRGEGMGSINVNACRRLASSEAVASEASHPFPGFGGGERLSTARSAGRTYAYHRRYRHHLWFRPGSLPSAPIQHLKRWPSLYRAVEWRAWIALGDRFTRSAEPLGAVSLGGRCGHADRTAGSPRWLEVHAPTSASGRQERCVLST